VSVVRGKDGFGFTICCDCPVRVQAVDPGGPAHQSGLRQGDSVLQLNGLPVETWKCVDLAHAIRSSSQIVLVIWRGSPELRSGCDALLRPPTLSQTTGRKLLPHPAHSKHERRRGQGSAVRSSLGALGSLWRDRKEEREEEQEEEEEEEEEVTGFSPHAATLKGTRLTSSHGDNYIILSPVSPGAQVSLRGCGLQVT
ncbi:regulator of G-protein signaling 3-like, partial [Plectropomus leopardus]|uniref:regulator of G-protein signaling 3-like n=1 Tax=Plectropomus leopardus TaxID=160734 RepID=UPI001C4AE060